MNILDSNSKTSTNSFKLKYAPHLGMFKQHAGKDPIYQLNFMADQGFINIAVGWLGGTASTVVAYYFGSSSGSDKMIDNQHKKNA